MGCTTQFQGRFETDKEMSAELIKELKEFADTRHGGNMNHDEDKPGFWCQWVPSEDGHAIEWDQGEKFYEYIDWLKYIIENFMKPNGIVLNGEVRFRGEDFNDVGVLVCVNNEVTVKKTS